MPEKPATKGTSSANVKELNSLFRQLMAGMGVLLAGTAVALAFVVKSDLSTVMAGQVSSRQEDGGTETVSQASSLPLAFFENWPSLRGPGNLGVAQSGDYPIYWDVESGEGIRWKSEIVVPGFNSPVIWKSRIFLTGADAEGQEVFCFDLESGEMLWTRTVETQMDMPSVSEETGYSAPTMTTDGTHVFAIFASGELAAFDMDGNPVWQKNIGAPENPYGMGSSLISDGERLFIQYDHENAKKVMALNGATGDLLWETARNNLSWASPSLISANGKLLLILNDSEFVTAYAPDSGEELWKVNCLGGEVAPSPAFNGKDILFVGNEYAQATALRLTDGEPEILWQYDEYLPEIASPLATAERIYIPTTAGDVVCLNIETGEVLWEQEFDEGFNSSPVCAGNRIYAADLSGVMHIFEDADVYHSIADLPLSEAVFATPAFVAGRIIIRGDYNLYCIEE